MINSMQSISKSLRNFQEASPFEKETVNRYTEVPTSCFSERNLKGTFRETFFFEKPLSLVLFLLKETIK